MVYAKSLAVTHFLCLPLESLLPILVHILALDRQARDKHEPELREVVSFVLPR